MKYGRQASFLHLRTEKFHSEVEFLSKLLTEEEGEHREL